MGIIDEGKSILNLVNKVANREVYDNLMEYLEKVFELQGERSELREKLNRAEATIKELEGKLAFKGKLKRHHEAYKVEGEDRVICMACWENNRKDITLKSAGCYTCPVCHENFENGTDYNANPSAITDDPYG